MEGSKGIYGKYKKIITGGILLLLCLAFCAAGILECMGTGKNRQTYEWITPDSVESRMEEILSWQSGQYGVFGVQELLDTVYAEHADNGIVQTYVMGLYGSMGDCYDYTSYAMSLRNAVLEESLQGVSLQKSIVLLSILREELPISAERMEETIGEQGIMSDVYGLLMLGGSSYEGGAWTKAGLVEELLSMQLPDGGFAVMGTEGDVDVTAMTLQILAPYYLPVKEQDSQTDAPRDLMLSQMNESFDFTQDTVERLIAAVERAVAFLSEKQLATGDFENRGTPNAESTAQVLAALCALGRDAWTDEAFIKDGAAVPDGLSRYRNADGGFGHTAGEASNDMATSQVFFALSALERMEQGKRFLFDFAGYEAADQTERADRDGETGQAEGADRSRETDQTQETRNVTEQTEKDKGKTAGGMSGARLRTAFVFLIIAADCGYFAYLCFKGKFSRRRLGGTALVTAVLMAAVCFFRIQTTEEYSRQVQHPKTDQMINVSMEIRCDTVAGERDYLPEDGVIMVKTNMSVSEEASAFDVLREAAAVCGIPIEYEGTAAGDGFAYIEGIAYLYEYDFGELSGWVFLVNGESPDTGCGSYQVADGDEIVWFYTKELGRDAESVSGICAE